MNCILIPKWAFKLLCLLLFFIRFLENICTYQNRAVIYLLFYHFLYFKIIFDIRLPDTLWQMILLTTSITSTKFVGEDISAMNENSECVMSFRVITPLSPLLRVFNLMVNFVNCINILLSKHLVRTHILMYFFFSSYGLLFCKRTKIGIQ